MPTCEICGQGVESLSTCKICGIFFCNECGDPKRGLCIECAEEV